MTRSPLQRAKMFLQSEKSVLVAFFSSRLAMWAAAWLAGSWFTPGPSGVKFHPWLWDMLFRWDAAWYATIVKQGYSYTPGAESNVAFFPLLPLLTAAVRGVTRVHLELAGFIVSNAALLASAVLLRRLASLDYPAPSRVPERAVWLLLFCPMTFFYSTMYTESLFLMLSLCVFLLARRREWLGAGVAGALLTATRGNALLIALPVIWEVLVARQRSESVDATRQAPDRSVWWLLLMPLGLVFYATYLHFRFGDALAFGHAQAAWGRSIQPPWVGIGNALAYPSPYRALVLGSAAVAVVACVLGYRLRLRLSYQIYAAASILFLLSSSIFHGLPRMLSVIFPLYLAIAAVGERSEDTYLFSLASSAALMGICVALFVSGYLMI